MRLRDAVTDGWLEQVRRLYEEAFPKSEKSPFSFILEGRDKGQYEVLALEEEDGSFCGLGIMMLWEDLALLDYFAVDTPLRGSGVGSRALKALRERYPEKKFLLEIENTNDLSASPEERKLRLRRKAFYLRGGLSPMDFLVDLFGVEMEILVYQDRVTFEEYHGIMEHVLPAGYADKVVLLES